ncbi:MAG: DUF4058 family protein [Gemmataceae bacterium]|nr:DUF4058 family protein [Gemmataceae bacterium]
MPIHDWSQIDAGVFHGFHTRWIARLAETLIPLLPEGYYAEAEQHAADRIADVLALKIGDIADRGSPRSDVVKTAVVELPRTAEYRTGRRRREKLRPRHVAIRHVSGHRVVALVEIVSPGNKDRRRHVDAFIDKAEFAITGGVHVVVVDLFPASNFAPNGLPSAIWRRFERRSFVPPPERPVSFGSFVGRDPPAAFFDYRAFGENLPPIPLFLTDDDYLELPLESTYQTTFENSPPYLREQLAPTKA